MATEQKLIAELVRAKMINAKREKEAYGHDNQRFFHWEGQETMAQQILTILES